MPTTTALKYNITHNDGDPSSVTLFVGETMHVANDSHRNFRKILEAISNGADEGTVVNLFDISKEVTEIFGRLSERMTITNGKVLFDGEVDDDFMAEMILAYHEQGVDDWKPLVAFREKIAQNPNQHSREQLFRWLTKNKFSIDTEGNIIAYKGVNVQTGLHDDDMKYRSVYAGKALVNGKWVHGTIPTNPGTIVEMPRSEVQHNPSVGCHRGLHAGDWSYASSFAQVTLRVQINPRDVVSVPTDCSERKMRVCRYRVLSRVTNQHDETLVRLDENELRTRAMPVQPKKESVSVGEVKAKAKKPVAKKTTEKAEKKAPAKASVAKKNAPVAPPVKVAAKKVVATKKAKAAPQPKFYEEFKRADFLARSFNELRWLAGEWEVKAGSNPNKVYLVDLLAAEASRRNRQFNKGTLKSKPVRVKK